VEATNQKEEKRKKPKPEEQEGMPQRQHCSPAIKRRGDRNPVELNSLTSHLSRMVAKFI
jgi:hypothetical protein